MKNAKEELKKLIEKKVAKEKDKWLSGMKNNYFAWCDLRDKLEDLLK